MSWWSDNPRMWTLILCLTFFTALEWVVPYFEQRQGKLKHDIRNFFVSGINGLLGAYLYALLIITAMDLSEKHQIGILHWFEMPLALHATLAFLLFDCWMYWWHRINHEVPFFWRFHRMHHTDPAMSASTGLRFHPGEIIFSFIARFFAIGLIGMRAEELVLYEVVLFVVIIFHHSNVHITRRFDDKLKLLFVSPHMHKVHHSEIVEETNSNYSSVFSIWDRIFGSFVHRDDPHNIRYGIGKMTEDKWQTVPGMIETPLAKD